MCVQCVWEGEWERSCEDKIGHTIKHKREVYLNTKKIHNMYMHVLNYAV